MNKAEIESFKKKEGKREKHHEKVEKMARKMKDASLKSALKTYEHHKKHGYYDKPYSLDDYRAKPGDSKSK